MHTNKSKRDFKHEKPEKSYNKQPHAANRNTETKGSQKTSDKAESSLLNERKIFAISSNPFVDSNKNKNDLKSKNEGPLAVQTDVNDKIQNPDINENTKCSTADKVESPELKHRKRITTSNWHRYEIDETQDEDYVQVANFNELLELSKNETKYLTDKLKPKIDEKAFKFDPNQNENIFSLDIYKLNCAFRCQPFYEHFQSDLHDGNKVGFTSNRDMLQQYDYDAKQALDHFNKLYRATKKVKSNDEQQQQMIKSSVCFDDIEGLKKLSLSEINSKQDNTNKDILVPNKINDPLSIDDWLDDVLLD